MDVKVKTKYLKISPRKLRPVVNLVRAKKAEKAKEILTFTPNKGARLVLTLLDSALAIVKSSEIEADKFYIKSIACSDGPRLKRGTPVSKGRMAPIVKRQSHLTITLSDTSDEKKSKIAKTDVESKTKESDKNKPQKAKVKE